jgi:hypothetical protein
MRRTALSPEKFRGLIPKDSATSAIAFPDDRRNRRRVAVHWLVRVFGRIGRKSLESNPEN